MTRLTFTENGVTPFQCHLHCDQCAYTALSGARCRRRVCFGTPVCWQHTVKEFGIKSKGSTLPNAGRGLFAVKDFQRWDWICPYVGEAVTDQCLTLRYGPGTAPYAVDADNGALDSACLRGIGSLANGLFTVNGNSRAERFHNAHIWYNPADRQVWLRAIRRIRAGDEVFVYYGNQYQLTNNTHSTSRRQVPDTRPC